jgi:hypothetical protein
VSIAAAGYHTGVAATITAGASAATSPTVAVSGDDVSGYATITVGTSPAAGVLATVTSPNAYLTNPKVQIAPGDAASAVGAL